MARQFIMPLWNVTGGNGPLEATRTTLAVEREERRYGTGRGYLVTAEDAASARRVATRYTLNGRGFPDDVQVIRERSGLNVLAAAPRW